MNTNTFFSLSHGVSFFNNLLNVKREKNLDSEKIGKPLPNVAVAAISIVTFSQIVFKYFYYTYCELGPDKVESTF